MSKRFFGVTETSDCRCFATLTDLANATTSVLPPGTSAVVVQQFDSNSAVSEAVYTPFPLTGTPGHPLAVLNTASNKWWVIHPDYISLEAAGAPPVGGDCAPAMQNVLNYLAVVTRARLQLWERDYLLSFAATLIQSNPNTDPALAFSIVGRGRGVSRLVVPYNAAPPKPLGAFAIIVTQNQSEFLARDFSVIASGATQSGSGCGTAMLVNYTNPGGGPGTHRGAIVENVHVGNDGIMTNSVSWSYFIKGIDITGTPRPLIDGVTIAGCDGGGTNNYLDSSPRYLAQTHLVLDECYSPHVKDCELWHAAVGISAVSTTNVQGFFMSGSHIEGVKIGVLHTWSYAPGAGNPAGTLAFNNIQFRDFGFDLANISKWRAAGNQFRNEWQTIPQPYTSYDMRFRAAGLVMLTGNGFDTQANNLRVNILIDPVSQVNGVNFAAHFLIDSHQFGEVLPAGSIFGTSGIKIAYTQGIAPASDIQIGASNQFVGTFTGSLVDDAAGVAVTSAGFSNTTSATPPPVLPNGILTLGTPQAAWLQTFSDAHFIQQHSAPNFPGAPWTGWVLYTDSSGKLWAWNGGTPKQLAP